MLDSTDPHIVHHHQSHEQQHNLMTGSVFESESIEKENFSKTKQTKDTGRPRILK